MMGEGSMFPWEMQSQAGQEWRLPNNNLWWLRRGEGTMGIFSTYSTLEPSGMLREGAPAVGLPRTRSSPGGG